MSQGQIAYVNIGRPARSKTDGSQGLGQLSKFCPQSFTLSIILCVNSNTVLLDYSAKIKESTLVRGVIEEYVVQQELGQLDM